jgi:hypothetical protein
MAERIGDFLVRVGAMTQGQVEDVARRQEAGDKRPFGEIALDLKYIPDNSPIDRFLEYQEKQLGD